MDKQITIADYIINQTRKSTRIEKKLAEIDSFVSWDRILSIISEIDKTGTEKGGRPRKELRMMVKILFIQYLYNFSDPELEDQLNDRLSFQRFVGIGFNLTIPDYTTIWRFKESLINEKIYDKIFEEIVNQIDNKGLILKKGTIVDATIMQSSNKPLSKSKREELEKNPSSQIDTDAKSTEKRGKKYFGHKGHIGLDVGSKIIRKKKMTPASVHDIKVKEELFSQDEQGIFGDKAYYKDEDKRKARKEGTYYGILDKAKKGKKLSMKQKKRNDKLSKVRAVVEHPFAFMKEKLNYEKAQAKNLVRNDLRFTMNCIIYNVFRASYLLKLAA